MITTSGLNSQRYNKPSKQEKKKRRTSYLRRINDMWKTEYEKYNDEEKHKSSKQSIDVESGHNYRSKDDSDSLRYKNDPEKSLLGDQSDSIQAGDGQYIVKSVCSADDHDQMLADDEIEKVDIECHNSTTLFQPIIEEEQEYDTTQRNTKNEMLDHLAIEYAASKLSQDNQKEVRMGNQSINNGSDNNNESSGSILKPCLVKDEKKRQRSHQTVDIVAFREKLKDKDPAMAMSFSHSKYRHDMEGNTIEHGARYKIKFADEIKEEDERKQSLATTHYVESYKRYNAPTCAEK